MVSDTWDRIRKFYRRNDVLFACIGLVVFTHIVWWEVQQNKAIVSKQDRVRHLGPFKIPYLDELDYFKNKKIPTQAQARNNKKYYTKCIFYKL